MPKKKNKNNENQSASNKTEEILDEIDKTIKESRKEILNYITHEYKLDKKTAIRIEEQIFDAALASLRDKYIFTEPFMKYTKKNILMDYFSDFINWSWIVFNIPFYQSFGD